MNGNYANCYSETSFWDKIRQEGKMAGETLCQKAFVLYYILERENLPESVKGEITEALGYFISPDDVIPDFVPAVGYTDDMDKIMEALKNVAEYVDEEVNQKASEMMHKVFPT
ncbi:MAG TPA: hypothetical protein DDZ89_13945 [Clostridiales bacterium]|nr:hypothetical protein [Clostridiales bacterium]